MRLLNKTISQTALIALFLLCGDAATFQKSGNSTTISAYKGVRLADGTVVASNDKTADISFPIHPTSMTLAGQLAKLPYGYLSAAKIKEFPTKPSPAAVTESEVERWKSYTQAPKPGRFYLLKARTGKYYLVQVKSLTDQTKGYHYWKLTLAWEQVSLKP